MNSQQIASLVEVGIPLTFGLLILVKPSVLTKKDLSLPENAKTKHKLLTCGKLLIFAGILITISSWSNLMPEEEIPTEDFLQEVASQSNAQFPKRIDENTVAESVSASGNTLSYHYTINGLDTSSITDTQFSEAMKPSILERFSSQPNLDIFRDRDVRIEHIFKCDDSDFKSTVIISPLEY